HACGDEPGISQQLHHPINRPISIKTPMQFFNMLQFAMLILLQQEATFAQRFGCKGHVKDHPISVCVAKLRIDPMDGPIVNVMTSPWDNNVGAYDCSPAPTGHKRPSCCPEADKVRFQYPDFNLPC
ncbi:hypothetical protein PSTT_09567, partial [Puccinia striiformis]